jgi:hypothetical protein
MVYSKVKPYNRTNYKGATDPSYDRFLKEAVNAGKAENVKESELEKPYNVKQTYGAMQQNYNPITPPVIDPGPGTGKLKCLWTSTGCEQLVGCWAGSDIVLDGPEAATAGYMPVEIITGEIVKQTINRSEGRALELIMSPLPRRNTFRVKFKDGLGVTFEQLIDIGCDTVNWFRQIAYAGPIYDKIVIAAIKNADVATTYADYDGSYYDRFNIANFITGVWSHEEIYTVGSVWETVSQLGVAIASSGDIYSGYRNKDFLSPYTNTGVYTSVKSGGSWTTTKVSNTELLYGDYVRSGIALDSLGYTHIIGVKPNAPYHRIIHITDASGSWQEEEITGDLDAVLKADFCILSDDTLQIVTHCQESSVHTCT